MIKIEQVEVMNLKNAIRGMRNPLNSWEKSDSYINEQGQFILGEKDLELCKKLCNAGAVHRKFARQIFVSMDITAPLYWWKEFDTYKVGTVANSTSTMHKIHSKEIGKEDFSIDKLDEEGAKVFEEFAAYIEKKRKDFVETKNKDSWYSVIQTLPSSYNQTRTCTMTYENLYNMYEWRYNHKLDEWKVFCKEVEKLPYFTKMFDIDKFKKEKEVER